MSTFRQAEMEASQAFHDHEMNVGPCRWERWYDRLERRLGFDLDGDGRENGYSLDGIYDLFCEGYSVDRAEAHVRAHLIAPRPFRKPR